MSDHLVRCTRSFIKRTAKKETVTLSDGNTEEREYLQFASGDRFHFPTRISEPLSHDFADDDPAKLMEDDKTLDAACDLYLPRYRLADYDNPRAEHSDKDARVLADIRSGRGDASGFVRIGLFKRLSSSGHSFILSLQRQRARNRLFLPRWGSVRLDRIATSDVRAWLAGLTGPSDHKAGPSMVRKTHGVFSQMLDLAVMDGRLPRNPARPAPGTRSFLPKLPRTRDHVYLTAAQLHFLAEERGPYRDFVLVLGYTGLRWGEATALRVRDVNPLQRRLTVARSVTEVGGELVWGTPKSHDIRTVPLPAFLRAR